MVREILIKEKLEIFPNSFGILQTCQHLVDYLDTATRIFYEIFSIYSFFKIYKNHLLLLESI